MNKEKIERELLRHGKHALDGSAVDSAHEAVDGLSCNPEHDVSSIDNKSSEKQGTRPVVVCMADVEPEEIAWLWPQRFAKGKLNLVAGDGGKGKSTMTLDIAARVSTGASWPDGSGSAPLGEVLILSAEDDPADTLRPRLDAAHADVSKIHVLSGVAVTTDGETREYCITLADLYAIEDVLKSRPTINLLIVDPIAAYLGNADSHVDAEVRALLAPLAKLAAKYRVAVLLVAHLNKSSATKAIYRVSGSQGTYNAVRMAWFVVADEDDADKRLLLPAKHNITRDPGGIAFRFGEHTSGVAHVQWIDGRLDVDLDDALAGNRDSSRATLDDAKAFLVAELAGGPVQAKTLKVHAEAACLGWRTVESAKSKLGIKSTRRSKEDMGSWWWELPKAELKPAENAPAETVRSCGLAANPPEGPKDSNAARPQVCAMEDVAAFNLDDVERLADFHGSSP